MANSQKISKKWASYRRHYHWFRLNEKTPNGPLFIKVEPTNVTNLERPAGLKESTRPEGFMDMSLFRKIIDQAPGAGVREVTLFLDGEPLLHESISEMVKYVVSKSLEAWLVTNGSLLDEEKGKQLLDAGLDKMWIRMESDFREDYKKQGKEELFDTIVENVSNLLRLRAARNMRKPEVTVQILKTQQHPGERIDPGFIARFDGLGVDEFFMGNPHYWREDTGFDPKYSDKGYYPCIFFWSAISIVWDGRVVGCSADLNANYILGDLNRESIMEVWNGAEMRRYRRLLKENRYEELDLCARCRGLWLMKHPKLSVLSELPVFEQMKNGAKRILAKRT